LARPVSDGNIAARLRRHANINLCRKAGPTRLQGTQAIAASAPLGLEALPSRDNNFDPIARLLSGNG
jgi:hypothetical protein